MTDDSVYDAMAGDIYGQGKVLALRKYKFLKWSYMSFLLGMMSAIVIFLFELPVFIDVFEVVDNQFGWNGIVWQNFREGFCQLSVVCRDKF